MDPKVNFVHLCEFASLSEGKLNVLGVFDGEIGIANFPMKFVVFYIVANITFPEPFDRKVTERISLVAPNGDAIKDYSIEFPVSKKNSRIGVIGEFTEVTFKEPGDYTLKVFINDDEIYSSSDLRIVKQ